MKRKELANLKPRNLSFMNHMWSVHLSMWYLSALVWLIGFCFLAAELFVNGEIVQRSPERQKRVEPVPQRAQDRPRHNDRTRYVKRRENQRKN
jgi:hypothetical protein